MPENFGKSQKYTPKKKKNDKSEIYGVLQITCITSYFFVKSNISPFFAKSTKQK